MTVRELISELIDYDMDAQVGLLIDGEKGEFFIPETITLGNPSDLVDEEGNPIESPDETGNVDESIVLLIPEEILGTKSCCDGECSEQCDPVPQDTNDE